ncbi:MAG TPA: C4-type zinc ribbon domain-containing protein [Mycobacteriales bacterium]|nr:C4-type zinc ribbon domain-containing protein [Mycobacteriales bacterium]
MNAPPEAQLRLLDLQDLDTTLGRLAHRRRTLPELAELARAEQRVGELRDARVGAETEDSDLARAQRKAEQDVDQVRARAVRDRQRLDAGAVSSPRELESLQSELASLARRQEELEDAVLDVMERREAVAARLEEVRAQQAVVEAEVTKLVEVRDAAYAEIDAEAARAAADRADVARELPGGLVALYERVRAASAGVGAARLYRGRCEGCHLQLNPADLGALRAAAPDAIVRCEECRRILVRTPESGL